MTIENTLAVLRAVKHVAELGEASILTLDAEVARLNAENEQLKKQLAEAREAGLGDAVARAYAQRESTTDETSPPPTDG